MQRYQLFAESVQLRAQGHMLSQQYHDVRRTVGSSPVGNRQLKRPTDFVARSVRDLFEKLKTASVPCRQLVRSHAIQGLKPAVRRIRGKLAPMKALHG